MKHLLSQLGCPQHTTLGNWCPVRMGDELADAMGNADLLGASRTSQQRRASRRNTTYPGPDEDFTAWKTQVEIALRGITDPKTKLTLDHVLSSNPRYITVDAVAAVAHDEGGTAAHDGNVLSRDLDGAITPTAAAVWSWVLHPNGSCDTLSLLTATWCTNKEPKPSQLLSRTSTRANGVHAGCTRVSCGGASGVLRLEIANGETPHAIWGSSAVGSLGEPGGQPRAA